MMSRRHNLQLIELALALTLAMTVKFAHGQVQETPTNLASHETAPLPPTKNNLPLPYSDSHLVQTEYQNSNFLPSDEQNSTSRPQFYKLLLERLDERKSNENNTSPLIPEYLTLTIQDSASNTVIIEFTPSIASPEQSDVWSSIVGLLADSLANVIQEAEQSGYKPSFRYSISLGESGFAFSPGLSANALKSAAG